MRVNPEITDQEIIIGAVTAFEKNGYANTDVRDIASEADVSETTIYRLHGPRIDEKSKLPKHKASKEKIARRLCEITDAILLKIWSENIAEGKGGDLIKTFFTQICQLIEIDTNTKVGLQLQAELNFQGSVVKMMDSFFSDQQKKGSARSDISPKSMSASLFSILQESVKKNGILPDECNTIIQILLDGFRKRDQ